jgi:glucosylceramidase
VYWNLVLDENHGPHAGGCDLCKGVVTVDSKTGEISRNDEYYAFAHFSRFVLPGAVRVKSGNTRTGVHQVAFRNPDHGSVVLVAVNGNTAPTRLSVQQGDTYFSYALPASSVATFEWPAAPPVQAPPHGGASAATGVAQQAGAALVHTPAAAASH